MATRYAVLITGHMRAGKSCAAKFLAEKYGFEVYSLADKIKQLHHEVTGSQEKDREWLQTFGYSCRKVFGEDFWAEQLIQQLAKDGMPSFVVDDVRYDNELDALVKYANDLGYTVVTVFVDVDFENIVIRGGEIHTLGHESEQMANRLHNRIKDGRLTYRDQEFTVFDGNLPLLPYYKSIASVFNPVIGPAGEFYLE